MDSPHRGPVKRRVDDAFVVSLIKPGKWIVIWDVMMLMWRHWKDLSFTGEPETDLDTNPFIVRFKNWMTGIFREPCGGRWVRTVCIFGVRDLPALGIKRQLIANKFHSTYQPVAYECMEELHYNRTRAEINGHTYFNTTYYSTRAFANSHVSWQSSVYNICSYTCHNISVLGVSFLWVFVGPMYNTFPYTCHNISVLGMSFLGVQWNLSITTT